MLDEQQLGEYIDSRSPRVLFRLETLDLYDVASNGDEYQRYVSGGTRPNPERNNARAGEHIRILDLAEPPRPADLIDEDFWLIDEREVLRMHNSQDGKYVGAELAPDEMLPRYLAAKDAAWSGAVDFADYWNAHPEYWRDPTAA